MPAIGAITAGLGLFNTIANLFKGKSGGMMRMKQNRVGGPAMGGRSVMGGRKGGMYYQRPMPLGGVKLNATGGRKRSKMLRNKAAMYSALSS